MLLRSCGLIIMKHIMLCGCRAELSHCRSRYRECLGLTVMFAGLMSLLMVLGVPAAAAAAAGVAAGLSGAASATGSASAGQAEQQTGNCQHMKAPSANNTARQTSLQHVSKRHSRGVR